ncbi:MAG TPA: hypothetical protein VH134_12965 [Candidatus Dormibacteraeota bacterium]|nr:hypothetical protein [Candidatus Dormibacteraeota bacterium]
MASTVRPVRLVLTLLVAGAVVSVAGGALRRRLGGDEIVDRDDPRIDVRLAAPTVVRGSVNVSMMRYPIAKPFCENIEAIALGEGADALVMDMGSLSKATPKAGMYAMKRLRVLPLRRIALLRGNRFMRAFAGVVLTLGGFPEFRFFDSEDTAVQWASARRAA